MMAFINNEVAEVVRLKLIEITDNALNTTANHISICVVKTLIESADSYIRPQTFKVGGTLFHKFLCVSQKQHTLADLLGIKNTNCGFSGAGCSLHQSNCLAFFTHFDKAGECLLLMLTQLKHTALLCRCVTIKISENW